MFSLLVSLAYTEIQSSPFDTFAIALDLGTIQNTTEPIVWAVGVVRDPAIQFTNANGQIEERRAYYWTAYSNIRDVVRQATLEVRG